MAASTVCISEVAHHMLQELVEKTGRTISHVLTEALGAYHRKLFFF